MRKPKLLYVFSFIFIFFIGLSEPVFAQQTGKIQKGSATWYGSRYHGRKTSSGEVYNKNRMTAAHPTLAFGTKVKVTHSGTNESVVVRINDRGPFKGGYIIDLSEAAAREIGLRQVGSVPVSVEVLSGPGVEREIAEIPTQPLVSPDSTLTAAPQLPYFVLQAGSFADQANARLQSERLKALRQDLPVSLNEEVVKGRKVHRVVAGRFSNRTEAEQFKAELEKKGILVLIKQLPGAS
jgi:rare lipoprotein A